MPEQYTEEQIEEIKGKIDLLTRIEMARLHRFAPSGHIYFRSDLPFNDHFNKRFFDELGGFSPEISKALG